MRVVIGLKALLLVCQTFYRVRTFCLSTQYKRKLTSFHIVKFGKIKRTRSGFHTILPLAPINKMEPSWRPSIFWSYCYSRVPERWDMQISVGFSLQNLYWEWNFFQYWKQFHRLFKVSRSAQSSLKISWGFDWLKFSRSFVCLLSQNDQKNFFKTTCWKTAKRFLTRNFSLTQCVSYRPNHPKFTNRLNLVVSLIYSPLTFCLHGFENSWASILPPVKVRN